MVKFAIKELENKLLKLNNLSYDSIDSLMRKIMRKYDLTAKELHVGFVNNHHKTPDTWVKEKMKRLQESKDHEGSMARTELDIIKRGADVIRKKIKKDNQELPAWIQSKITRAADYVQTTAGYMQSSENIDEEGISFKIGHTNPQSNIEQKKALNKLKQVTIKGGNRTGPEADVQRNLANKFSSKIQGPKPVILPQTRIPQPTVHSRPPDQLQLPKTLKEKLISELQNRIAIDEQEEGNIIDKQAEEQRMRQRDLRRKRRESIRGIYRTGIYEQGQLISTPQPKTTLPQPQAKKQTQPQQITPPQPKPKPQPQIRPQATPQKISVQAQPNLAQDPQLINKEVSAAKAKRLSILKQQALLKAQSQALSKINAGNAPFFNVSSMEESITNKLIAELQGEHCGCEHEPVSMKGHKKISQIAKKHNVPIKAIQAQLKMGMEVEKEHTKDSDMAMDIALQHLAELPDYYTQLKKIERQKNESVCLRDVNGNITYEFIDLVRPDPIIEERNKRYPKGRRKGDPCWKNYKQVGMKTLRGREVPNCVPIEEATLPTKHGQVIVMSVCWRSKKYPLQMFFPQSRVPGKKEIQYEVDKIYPGAKLLFYKVGQLQQSMPLIQIQNSPSKNYLLNNGTIGEEIINELKSAAWTREEGQNKTGGLNKKGIESYRRENPGSTLSMAVTTKPSELKKGSKKWKRRKSFCARSAGQMKMWPKAARNPKSRLRLARKKWNCE